MAENIEADLFNDVGAAQLIGNVMPKAVEAFRASLSPQYVVEDLVEAESDTLAEAGIRVLPP